MSLLRPIAAKLRSPADGRLPRRRRYSANSRAEAGTNSLSSRQAAGVLRAHNLSDALFSNRHRV